MTPHFPRAFTLTTSGVIFVVSLWGCASSKPVLYPNDHYKTVGQSQAEIDIHECLELAERHTSSSNKGQEMAQDTAVGAGVGAASGAVIGAVREAAGKGAAVGAAAGATGGFLRSLLRSSEPNPAYKNFVNACLKERGYQPVGWE